MSRPTPGRAEPNARRGYGRPSLDAFKRAVKFEVGAYLYAMGRLCAEVKIVNGKAVGTDAGRKTPYDAYARWLADPKLNTFGEPLDHGDLSDHETEVADDPGG